MEHRFVGLLLSINYYEGIVSGFIVAVEELNIVYLVVGDKLIEIDQLFK